MKLYLDNMLPLIPPSVLPKFDHLNGVNKFHSPAGAVVPGASVGQPQQLKVPPQFASVVAPFNVASASLTPVKVVAQPMPSLNRFDQIDQRLGSYLFFRNDLFEI